MRRLLIAAAFAVAFHGWLLSTQTAWLLPEPPKPLPRRAVAIALEAAPVKKPAPEPARPAPAEEKKIAPPAPRPPAPKQKIENARLPEPKRPPKQVKKSVPAEPPAPAPEKKQAPPPPAEQFSSLFDALHAPEKKPLIPDAIADLKAPDKPAQAPTGAPAPAETSGGNTAPVIEARPLYRQNPPPEYPRIARRRGYEGTVRIDALVDEDGRVREVKIRKSSGHAALDRAALSAVKKWRFEPGRRGAEPVRMWVEVPVRFELR